jgi:hypothetical protein
MNAEKIQEKYVNKEKWARSLIRKIKKVEGNESIRQKELNISNDEMKKSRKLLRMEMTAYGRKRKQVG